VVEKEDTASFFGEEVHPVYATFALARDVEWTSRLFVVEMRDADEEGIGTYVSVNHLASALVGEEICIHSTIKKIIGNEIICHYEVHVKDRKIAEGSTGQKIIKKEKIKEIFEKIKNEKK